MLPNDFRDRGQNRPGIGRELPCGEISCRDEQPASRYADERERLGTLLH